MSSKGRRKERKRERKRERTVEDKGMGPFPWIEDNELRLSCNYSSPFFRLCASKTYPRPPELNVDDTHALFEKVFQQASSSCVPVGQVYRERLM